MFNSMRTRQGSELFYCRRDDDADEEVEEGQVNPSGRGRFSNSGADDDHNRDTDADRDSKSPALHTQNDPTQ